jgi:hypothetical protein
MRRIGDRRNATPCLAWRPIGEETRLGQRKGVVLIFFAGVVMAALAAFMPQARGQGAAPLWTNIYNGPGNNTDVATGMTVDGSGNVLVTGLSMSSGNFHPDYATIKYSGAGVALWTNRYNGPANDDDIPRAVAVDGSGNVFVTGSSASSVTLNDYLTIKYSGAGVPLWTNRYNGPGSETDVANAMVVDGSGSVIVTGQSRGFASVDYATVKYSGTGLLLWTRRYNGPGNSNDTAHAVAVDGSGNVIVTGQSHFSGASLFDQITIKYSGAGVALWTNRYNGPENSNDNANAVAVDSSGNVFVTGCAYSNASRDDYVTIKYSGAGVALWTNRYNGPANGSDYANRVAVDGNGNVLVSGRSAGASGFDYATIKYSGAGVPLWTNRYNGPGNSTDEVYGLAVDGSGNVFVTGLTYGSGGTNSDFATIAYSSAGMSLWTNYYNGAANGDDRPTGLALDGSGSVFVAGFGIGSDYDYVTLKYGAIRPLLRIFSTTTNAVILSWPSASNGFMLQQNTNEFGPLSWSNVTGAVQDNGTNKTLVVPLPTGNRFYRLFKP